jgi:serine/threonine-protein kinase
MAERCATCGNERPAGARGPCPTCLLGLGLKDRKGPLIERLGAYQIVSRLGAGGMGEVYRAHDARLGRDVAIKVLPDTLEGDPERLARFRREARVAASLNHPHIAGIHGFEDEDGVHFLVMELIEGSTLSETLGSGPLPIDEALAIVEQIAEGLEAAHESGVVHRDLKPSNIKITPAGQAKILDFGLAKAESGAAAGADLGVSTAGTVFGTIPYMSPEQARGRPVDKRTDIWSLGCVLYECLSGRRTFDGDTSADVIGKIVEREPDWDALPARTPPRVRDLLARCLEKDPKLRVRDAGDVRIELARARAAREWTSTGSLRVSSSAAPGKARRFLPWTIAALGLAVAAAVFAATFMKGAGVGKQGSASIPMRVVVTDPDAPRVPYEDAPTVAISPDGLTIAYVGKGPQDEGTRTGLYLRRAEEVRARRLDLPCEDHQVYDPFFSPDGRSIGFSCGGLYRMPLDGGPAVRLLESGIFLKGATWVSDGIVFSPAARAGLVMAKEGGGPLETVTVPDVSQSEVSHRWPSALPDGRRVLFTIKKEGIASFDQGEIALLDLDTRSYKTLIRGGSFARWLPTGHIVFARGSTLMGVAFDPRREEVVGEPIAVTDGVMTEPGSGAAQYAAARDAGTLVLVPGGVNVPRKEFIWIDRKGSVTPVGAPLLPYEHAAISPDGTRLACTVFGATDTVVVYDMVQRSVLQLTSEGNCVAGHWTPDGRQVVYGSDQAGSGTLVTLMRNADGSGGPRRFRGDLDFGQARLVIPLPDGPGLVYEANDGLRLAPLHGEPTTRRLGGERSIPHLRMSLSPDGRWLAYSSSTSGRAEIYVRTFPGDGKTWQITHGGGSIPLWSRRGGEIFYSKEPGGVRRMCSARVSATSNQITAAPPVDLFDIPVDTTVIGLHPDGERFLALRRVPATFKGERVEAVLHWSDQVAARVPARALDKLEGR